MIMNGAAAVLVIANVSETSPFADSDLQVGKTILSTNGFPCPVSTVGVI
jgi:hypothetical protein